MKLVTFQQSTERPRAGLVTSQGIIDLAQASYLLFPDEAALPDDLLNLLYLEEAGLDQAYAVYEALEDRPLPEQLEFFDPLKVRLSSPILRPGALLDFYTFEQHVRTCRAKRNLDVVPNGINIPFTIMVTLAQSWAMARKSFSHSERRARIMSWNWRS